MAIILKLRRRCNGLPPQPSDSLILVSWPCPEGHFPIIPVIQTYLSRTFHLAVEGHENAQHNRDNLANFLRILALPREVELWSMTTLREKLVKIGAKVVSHGQYVTFQLAEVAVPRNLFRKILR